MTNPLSYPDRIRQLLLSKTVLSLKQLRHELGDRPRSSLFRDLQKVELLTSYSHAGQYHALQSTITFNRVGLWFYGQAAFSKYGTLKNTLASLVSSSSAGMTHKELKILLRIQVQNALTHLIKTGMLKRKSLPGQSFVYLSHEALRAQVQWRKREALDEKATGMALPPESVVIDILLEIIREDGSAIDESVLGSRLKKQGVAVPQQQLVYVLAYYDIKKN
ncbi:MAG: hypothetical protein ABW168_27175 [Sedimenticola sp.]